MIILDRQYKESRNNFHALEAHHRLFNAIILRALNDIGLASFYTKKENGMRIKVENTIKEDALKWIFDEKSTFPFICEMCNLDVNNLRQEAKLILIKNKRSGTQRGMSIKK